MARLLPWASKKPASLRGATPSHLSSPAKRGAGDSEPATAGFVMFGTPLATLLEDPHGCWAQQLITNQVLYQLSYAGVWEITL
jgi:hypothetical protein